MANKPSSNNGLPAQRGQRAISNIILERENRELAKDGNIVDEELAL